MSSTTTLNALGFLVRRRRVRYWLLLGFLSVYVVFCAVVFFQWVNPSLLGETDQRIAADSGTYIYMADVLREGRPDPWVYEALASFPNTLWMPVFLAYVIKNTIWVAVLNLALFGWSIELFKRTSRINVGLFVALLLVNPTTTVSLLSVNKEIIDLFAVALFCFALQKNRKVILCIALALALLNRYEVCLAMMILLFAQSKFNPARHHRWWTLAGLVFMLNLLLPLLAARALATRFEEASSGGLVAVLDKLEMQYLFAVATIPKILEGMFGELLNVSRWAGYSINDLANSYILFFNNLAFLLVIAVLLWKRLVNLRSDWIYFALLGSVLMSVSLVIQPRYFYFCYVLFCFQAAQPAMAAYRRSRLIFGEA